MERKNNKRLTRRSYRRKLVMFGVTVFMSLALTATGFAAWVLSQDAQKDAEGSIEVGAVTEATVEISDIIFTKLDDDKTSIKNFIFEPLADDDEGRVQYDGTSKPENLDVSISWTVSNYQNVGQHFIEFKIPADVKAAIDKKYITLPEGFTLQDSTIDVDDKTYYVAKYTLPAVTATGGTTDNLVKYTLTEEGGVKTVVFEMSIKFGWGEAFGNTNPGLYYDDAAKDVAHADVKAALNQFKATMHGITYNQDFEDMSEADKAAEYDKNPIDIYYVVIHATVK